MKDIDLPESVIEAGYEKWMAEGSITGRAECVAIFIAMARALVEHDRENDIVAVVRLREDGSLETLYGSPPP